MSTIFAINENNGFLITSDEATLVSDIEAVLINCQHEVQTLKGEDPFSQNKGMPNFDTVWGGNPNILQFEFFLRKTLLAVENVTRVSNFDAVVDNGILNYQIKIHTPFGDDVLSGTNNA